MTTVISVENLSKSYRLGQIGTGTFAYDLNVWWARLRGKPNPLARIGEKDHGNRVGEEVWALKDVSFQVKQGEVLGIIGRNGAGKSTLLKILSRVTAPTSGEIKVKGRVASLLEVGTGFHPDLTGRENVYLNGAILGMTRAEVARKFDEIVDFAGVDKFIDTPVKRYSSGMYVRLAFAVAAHLDPEILVVDEVLAVGDAEFQKKCLGKMGEVAHQGKTVLFVSHNMAAIQNLCPRSLLLTSGTIEVLGDTSLVVSEYLKVNGGGLTDNLKDRKDRGGNGAMRFVSASLCDDDGNLVHTGQTGSPLNIRLDYESSGGSLPAVVEVVFRNADGNKLFVCLSRNSYKGILRLAERGAIICRFSKFPLLRGRYSVDVWCKLDEAMADEVNSALVVDVVSGDYFGTGKINPNMQNGLLVQHEWVLS